MLTRCFSMERPRRRHGGIDMIDDIRAWLKHQATQAQEMCDFEIGWARKYTRFRTWFCLLNATVYFFLYAADVCKPGARLYVHLSALVSLDLLAGTDAARKAGMGEPQIILDAAIARLG